MTRLCNLFAKFINALLPLPEESAWDEYKRAKLMMVHTDNK
jgi:hypothetical protein